MHRSASAPTASRSAGLAQNDWPEVRHVMTCTHLDNEQLEFLSQAFPGANVITLDGPAVTLSGALWWWHTRRVGPGKVAVVAETDCARIRRCYTYYRTAMPASQFEQYVARQQRAHLRIAAINMTQRLLTPTPEMWAFTLDNCRLNPVDHRGG